MIRFVLFTFAGSFQCRLAVGMDSSNDSPTDPYGTYGKQGRGGTFAYRERPFDRIIRLSGPLDLRAAAVDPWEDVKVKTVQVGADPIDAKAVGASPLIGSVVTLGDKAKFEEDGPYNIIDAGFAAGSLFTSVLADKPSYTGGDDRPFELFGEYTAAKSKLIQAAGIDPVRVKVLTEDEESRMKSYAGIFRKFTDYGAVFLPGGTRLLANFDGVGYGKMDGEANYAWGLSMRFERWDGDALTGRVSGSVLAIHRSLIEAADRALDKLISSFGRMLIL